MVVEEEESSCWLSSLSEEDEDEVEVEEEEEELESEDEEEEEPSLPVARAPVPHGIASPFG